MNIDLRQIRLKHKLSCMQMAKIAEVSESHYRNYELSGAMPSQHVYLLWTRLSAFPLPVDFFCYTSKTLAMNMKYHHISSKEIVDAFSLGTSSKLNKLLVEDVPMYEQKELFSMFNPLIVCLNIKLDRKNGCVQEGTWITNLYVSKKKDRTIKDA